MTPMQLLRQWIEAERQVALPPERMILGNVLHRMDVIEADQWETGWNGSPGWFWVYNSHWFAPNVFYIDLEGKYFLQGKDHSVSLDMGKFYYLEIPEPELSK